MVIHLANATSLISKKEILSSRRWLEKNRKQNVGAFHFNQSVVYFLST